MRRPATSQSLDEATSLSLDLEHVAHDGAAHLNLGSHRGLAYDARPA
ncbi:hypothetical protein [Sphingobium sp. RSMS]|nr:hypothetical protein [Sphingobium sp. RSMS]